MKITTPLYSIAACILLSIDAFAVTVYFQDGTELDGTATPGMPPEPYTSSSSFPAGSDTIITDFVYQDGVLGDPTTYSALAVGNTWGGSGIARTVLDIDLTRLTASLLPAPAGLCYQITALRLALEVSGNHPSAPPINFYLGNQAAGQPTLGTPIATQSGYTTSGTFVTANLPVSALGTTDVASLGSNFAVTLASALEGDGRYVNLGSSIGPNSWSNSGQGSSYQYPNPRLEIDYELVKKAVTIPEPTRALLLSLAALSILARRGR